MESGPSARHACQMSTNHGLVVAGGSGSGKATPAPWRTAGAIAWMSAVKWAQPRWRPKRSLTSRVKPGAIESPTSCWSGGNASGQIV